MKKILTLLLVLIVGCVGFGEPVYTNSNPIPHSKDRYQTYLEDNAVKYGCFMMTDANGTEITQMVYGLLLSNGNLVQETPKAFVEMNASFIGREIDCPEAVGKEL